MTSHKKHSLIFKLIVCCLLSLILITQITLPKGIAFADNKDNNQEQWLAMQSETGIDGTVNFYPAFKQGDATVAGYKFAVKKGDDFTELNNVQTMCDIATALKDSSVSDSHTLYYQKVDKNADSLKGYTVIDKWWNDVFDSSVVEGPAKKYDDSFFTNFCTKGIYSAQLGILEGDGSINNPFGANWSTDSYLKPNNPPTVNGVNYGGADGFLSSYGISSEGGIFNSVFARSALSNCAVDESNAFIYDEDGKWSQDFRDQDRGIILAKYFDDGYTVRASVEAGHGIIKNCSVIVPRNTPYTIKGDKIILGTNTDSKVIQYDNNKTYYLFDKWMIGDDDASLSGTVVSDMTFSVKNKHWLPMQAVAGDSKTINFCPAFKDGDAAVAGYRFAVKKGNVYTEVQKTMAAIGNALRDRQISEEGSCLYYDKEDTGKLALKCFATQETQWDRVFIKVGKGDVYQIIYQDDFKRNYIDKGIYTAELDGDKFGGGGNWNWDGCPKVNNIDFYDFYQSYMHTSCCSSTNENFWGTHQQNKFYLRAIHAAIFYFLNNKAEWSKINIHDIANVVLAKEF